MGQPITPSEGLQLANSLIDGKSLQDELKPWQANKTPFGLLFYKYWGGFVKRDKRVLESAKAHLVAANRTEWVTYQNIECMYNLAYEQMVSAALACRLLESREYWVDKNGEQIICDNNAVGKEVNIDITN